MKKWTGRLRFTSCSRVFTLLEMRLVEFFLFGHATVIIVVHICGMYICVCVCVFSLKDTRRAMIKSYQTSGGTVLSTNWKEVREKEYEKELQAPAGQEFRKWGE